VRIQIDREKCQGHGRCYELAPLVFTEDEEGYSVALNDGVVAAGSEELARLAVANCPESAIAIVQED